MGLPEDYDWGITPEALGTLKKGMSVSVGVSLGPAEAAKVIEASKEIEGSDLDR